MTAPIRVLIADDHEAVRSGVAAILNQDEQITMVGEAENGFEALANCHRLFPDVALIDLRMPGTDGIWATERITVETVTRVLVLTTYDSDDLVTQALAAGAHGYLLKSTSGAELLAAVKHVAADRHVIDPTVAGSIIARVSDTFGGNRGAQLAGLDLKVPLTPRERQVLQLLAGGLSNQQIAEQLHLSVTTVKTHLGSLYAKTGASSRVALARFAASA